MIAVRLMGGLGNQMFQYALGLNIAARLDVELALDVGWFDEPRPGLHPERRFKLDALVSQHRLVRFSEQQIAILEAPRGIIPTGWKVRPKLNVIRESSREFDEGILASADASLFIGYWQSEKYFADVAAPIRAAFGQGPSHSAPETYFARLRTAPSVGIHVRRGDYVTVPETASVHGALGPDYYQSAFAYIAANTDIRQAVVFSDDPAWAMENLSFPVPTWHASPDLQDDRSELDLLKACDHQIIANSSFSWWGAWLNPNDKKIVVAPTRWYRDHSIDTADLVPPQWHRV